MDMDALVLVDMWIMISYRILFVFSAAVLID